MLPDQHRLEELQRQAPTHHQPPSTQIAHIQNAIYPILQADPTNGYTRAVYNTASTNSRLLAARPPLSVVFHGKSSAIRAHCSSLNIRVHSPHPNRAI